MSNKKSSQGEYLGLQTASVVTTDGGEDDSEASIEDLPKATALASMNVENAAFVKGVVQEPAYRDKWFGLVFLAQLGIMMSVAICYAAGILTTEWEFEAQEGDAGESTNNSFADGTDRRTRGLMNAILPRSLQQDEGEDVDVGRLMFIILFSLLSAPALAVVAMKLMKTHAVSLIQYSLFFAIGFNVLLGLLLTVFGDDASTGGIVNFIFAAILVCYAKAVWHRIPFAAANLKAAVTCVESNLGMVLLGIAIIPLVTGWFILWTYTFVCIYHSPWMTQQESEMEVTDDFVHAGNTHEEETLTAAGSAAIIGLVLSFYWTYHVLRNVLHTTLAGTVGTWWFLPQEASSFCSRGLTDSWTRSLTYSFGSICFGSLLVAIIEVIKSMVQSAARNRRAGIFRLVAQCLLTWIERIAEYFNKWAFVYVGLYGYSYIEAGKNVFTLFRNRGWSAIISDSLVNRMLLMMCFCIGLVNAVVAVILSLGSDSVAITASFGAFCGFFTGIIMSSMAFGVVISAVDTIIVLYAEAPAELRENHPHICQELEETWTQAWPGVFCPSSGAVIGGDAAVATPVV